MPNQHEVLSDGKIGIVIDSPKYGKKMAIIDARDIEIVKAYSWSVKKDRNTFYACTGTGTKTFVMHRLILGLNDSKIKTDHRNHNGLHNWRSNLRKANSAENGRNRPKQKN